MSEFYVNEAAEFDCPALKGSFTARELHNRSVKACGKLLMTASGTKLTGNGTCKILSAASGTTMPCICKMSGSLSGWQFLSKNTAANSPLLLKNSSAKCNVGAVVKITESGQRKIFKGESVEPLAALTVATVTSA